MRILLIAGHGDGDSGAVGNGYKEADLTREMVKLIAPRLLRYCDVDIADTSKNWYREIIKKGVKFNFKPFDYVLEVHLNAVKIDAGDGETKGTEIYVTQAEKSATVEEKIVKYISTLGLKNRGVKRKNYDLINHIKKQGVSAALLEVCFIDDADDMKIYKEHKGAIADEVVKGIAEGFKLKKEEKELTKADVIAIIKEYEAEKAKEAVSGWSKESFAKAKAAGVMDGSAPKSPATREQLAVILDRLGLLK